MYTQQIYLRLTEKHDGVYLAKKVADCLKRFGLRRFVCLTTHVILILTDLV